MLYHPVTQSVRGKHTISVGCSVAMLYYPRLHKLVIYEIHISEIIVIPSPAEFFQPKHYGGCRAWKHIFGTIEWGCLKLGDVMNALLVVSSWIGQLVHSQPGDPSIWWVVNGCDSTLQCRRWFRVGYGWRSTRYGWAMMEEMMEEIIHQLAAIGIYEIIKHCEFHGIQKRDT